MDPTLTRPPLEVAGLHLGEITEQLHFSHALTIRNTTRHAIAITTFRTGCECTNVSPSSLTLLPRQSRAVVVTLDLSQLAWSPGQRVQDFSTLLLPECDGIAGTPPWTLTGRIRRNPMTLSPNTLTFGTVPAGRPASKSMEVQLPATHASSTLDVRCEPEDVLNVYPIPAGGDGTRRLLCFELASSLRPTSFEVVATISAAGTSSDPGTLRRSARITGEIEGDIAAQPEALLFGAQHLGGTGRDTLRIFSHSGRPFSASFNRLPQGVAVRPLQLPDAPSGALLYEIEQTFLRAGNHLQTIEASLHYADASNGSEVIHVPVHYYGRAPEKKDRRE